MYTRLIFEICFQINVNAKFYPDSNNDQKSLKLKCELN